MQPMHAPSVRHVLACKNDAPVFTVLEVCNQTSQ